MTHNKTASRWKQDFFENHVPIELLGFPEKLHTKLVMLGRLTLKDIRSLTERDLLIDKLA